MQYLLLIHLLAIFFVLSNLDNIALMLAFFTVPSNSRVMILAGFVGAMLTIIIAMLLIYAGAKNVIPVDDIRYIGIAPIAMGLMELFTRYFSRLKKQQIEKTVPNFAPSLYRQFGGNYFAQLSISLGSTSIFLPLLLKLPLEGVVIYVSVWLALTILLSLITLFLGRFIAKLNWLSKFSSKLMPLFLIGIGLYVLFF